jgi:hypothetical protein
LKWRALKPNAGPYEEEEQLGAQDRRLLVQALVEARQNTCLWEESCLDRLCEQEIWIEVAKSQKRGSFRLAHDISVPL